MTNEYWFLNPKKSAQQHSSQARTAGGDHSEMSQKSQFSGEQAHSWGPPGYPQILRSPASNPHPLVWSSLVCHGYLAPSLSMPTGP